MKKILVIQNKRIGDVLLASIIPSNLKKMYPQSVICFLCYDYAAPVLLNNPNIDRIITVNDKELKKIKNLFKLAMRIRKEGFDIIIDPYVKFQSQFISLLSGAQERISYEKKVLPGAYTKQIPVLKKRISPYGKAIDDRINLIKDLNPEMAFDVHPKLYLSEEEKANGAKRLENLDKNKKTLMFSALGSDPTKSVPIDYIARILSFITENYDFNILLNYMPSQAALVTQILTQVNKKENIHENIVGQDIREFLTLLVHCDFLIGNEGGSVHMAKALGKPTFTIYSPYILKDSWATFENEPIHQSIHLDEVRPELFEGKSRKEIKETSANLYEAFTPDLIIPSLMQFIEKFGE